MIKTLQNTLKQDKEHLSVPKSVQDTIPIRPEAVDGDGILYGLWHRKVLFVLLQCVLKSLNQVGWPPLLMCVP